MSQEHRYVVNELNKYIIGQDEATQLLRALHRLRKSFKLDPAYAS